MNMQGLYAIADSSYLSDTVLIERCKTVLENGCRMLQYRDKRADQNQWQHNAEQLQKLCSEHQASFIINDHLSLAGKLGCGVHLGKDDLTIEEARKVLGPDIIIGASCYNSIALAQQAANAGASYLAFGRFFSSSTKPTAPVADISTLSQAVDLGLPIVAIGGITPDNGAQLRDAGADMLAVIADLWTAPNLATQCQRYQQLFKDLHD